MAMTMTSLMTVTLLLTGRLWYRQTQRQVNLRLLGERWISAHVGMTDEDDIVMVDMHIGRLAEPVRRVFTRVVDPVQVSRLVGINTTAMTPVWEQRPTRWLDNSRYTVARACELLQQEHARLVQGQQLPHQQEQGPRKFLMTVLQGGKPALVFEAFSLIPELTGLCETAAADVFVPGATWQDARHPSWAAELDGMGCSTQVRWMQLRQECSSW